MSEKQDQEKLVEVLKFTPRTYRVTLTGYGGEVVMGRVSQETVDYFEDNAINIDEYAFSWDSEDNFGVPEEHQFIESGSFHECDDIAHENGVEFSEFCNITVYDENDQPVWSSPLSYDSLEQQGIQIDGDDIYYNEHIKEGEAAFFAQSTEKGLFFGAALDLTMPFDPAKLSIDTIDVQGWTLATGVSYNDEALDSEDYDTVGKGSSADFLKLQD